MSVSETQVADQMARFGIVEVPTYRYHYRDWQYSNLDDALAQALRDAASEATN